MQRAAQEDGAHGAGQDSTTALLGATDNLETPVVQNQPHSSNHQYEPFSNYRFRRNDRYSLFRDKDDENCPCHIMSYLNDQAELVDKPVRGFSHYSLLAYACNVSCAVLLGFPLAFPFMYCAYKTAKSVRILNEQNDYISSRVCSWCVCCALFMMVLGGMASWGLIGYLIYAMDKNPVAFIVLILVICELVLMVCGSSCLPLMSQALSFIKTSRAIKKESKALMHA